MLPVISASQSLDLLGAEMAEACRSGGMFYLVDHGIDRELIARVMAETAVFFAQSDERKNNIHISKSSNHRGYGLLKNYRDWREQIHLGIETGPVSNSAGHYWSLWGPNQWPQTEGGDDDQDFKDTIIDYFQAVFDLSLKLLRALALSLGRSEDFFTARMWDHPYLLMKAMSYLPQENLQAKNNPQSGVTAHCDWSWLTLLIQDDVGGLEAQDRDGVWHAVDPRDGAIVVNTGELLEIETGGRFIASPHRVINSKIDRQRYSIPVFINPALDAQIYPSGVFTDSASPADFREDVDKFSAHIHKVIKPGTNLTPFVFGESEFKRKAMGQWCYHKDCLVAV